MVTLKQQVQQPPIPDTGQMLTKLITTAAMLMMMMMMMMIALVMVKVVSVVHISHKDENTVRSIRLGGEYDDV